MKNTLCFISCLSLLAKNAVKARIRPTNTQLALLTISAIVAFSSVNEVQAQDNDIAGDTIYATGIFSAKNNETGNPVSDVNLHVWSNTVPMENQHISKNYITDNNGGAPFNNPGIEVYIDSTTGINDLIENNTKIFPTIGSEMNAFFEKIEKGTIEVYNISGQLVRQQKFNSDQEYLQLNDVAAGMYIYHIKTESGLELGGKFIKQNTAINGPASRPINSTLKETQFYSANYWIVWDHIDFKKDSIQVELEEGNNGFVKFYMTPINGAIPQHQDIVGIAKDDENNNAPTAGVTAILYNITHNQTITKTTGSDGEFVFEDVPTGSECTISVGGLANYYSFNDQTCTIPAVIESMNDTIAEILDVVMYEKQSAITDLNILIQQTGHGTLSQERKYYFNASVSSADQNIYNNYYNQLDAMGNNYIHVQTTNPDEANIHIADGTFNTQTSVISFETPLGIYYPTTTASSTMHPGDFGAFGHEAYQQDGKSQCGGTGILSSNPPETGPDAQDLAIAELEMKHWVHNVYTNQETSFNLNNISETLSSKSPEFSKPDSTKSGVEFNYISK